MPTERRPENKPLSFNTTLRNPRRIANYLNCLIPFEGQTLTRDVMMGSIRNAIRNKVYSPVYIGSKAILKNVHDDVDSFFTEAQIDEIIQNTNVNHKEAGFEKGWESRFETIFKLPKELGLIYYVKDEPLRISATGHMIVDALNEEPINEEKIQNVLLNSLVKYQSDNPFRKNLNSNVPLVLLLQVIKLLKDDPEENDAGVFIQEVSLFLCWENNSAEELYRKIKEIRRATGFTYSNEYMYDICMELLHADETKRNRFKLSLITHELVDDYVRMMRCTGVISFRGNGRFLDFNTFLQDKIDYILENYNEKPTFESPLDFFEYMQSIDNVLITPTEEPEEEEEVKLTTLRRFATEYEQDHVLSELRIVCAARRTASDDPVLRYLSEPVRMEFLTSIALLQQFENIRVKPNYVCDDEGLPTHTAGGGMADIVCLDNEGRSLVEVTLMRGRAEQVNNEMIPIKRHLSEAVEEMENTFSVFVAPIIHEDVREYIRFNEFENQGRAKPLHITAFDVEEFINAIRENDRISQLLA